MRKKLLSLFLLGGCIQLAFSQSQSIDKLIDIFNNPAKYPNYIMISAHRGYWKDYPENSLPAIQAALDLGADMIEFDITKSDDGTLYLLHDYGLDRLTTGHGIVRKGEGATFEYYKSWDELKDLKLKEVTGEVSEYKLATLRDALLKCKNKALVSIDKAENVIPEMYYLVKDLGMVNQVTFKTKIQFFPTPESIKRLVTNKADQEQLVKMFTPTVYSELLDQDPDLINKMKAFIGAGCQGFEMIYFQNSDPMLTRKITVEGKTYDNILSWLRTKNTCVIQFPMWPETEKGCWVPRKFKYSIINLKGTDRRCDWDWLLEKSHAPDVVISDRLEVLFDYLKTIGKRSL
ncbi:glycerophosphodiester phosphodiesterase family protein [Bacteroides intestinalis]|uniref:glycerophosphodiester phosphodiesterase family protein n=1 Tax=Bacteroides intestinalis TaxID=329854 RepID=UPI00189E0B15|nr:glycerophosphodiester phosphodiesterase family protein [Bacteroides intestinalis]